MEGDTRGEYNACTTVISIHTLRVEGDRRGAVDVPAFQQFLSTPSVWRVTLPIVIPLEIRSISIHTLRVEGDTIDPSRIPWKYISIHTLRVEGDPG